MKKILLLLMAVALFSCDNNKVAVEDDKQLVEVNEVDMDFVDSNLNRIDSVLAQKYVKKLEQQSGDSLKIAVFYNTERRIIEKSELYDFQTGEITIHFLLSDRMISIQNDSTTYYIYDGILQKKEIDNQTAKITSTDKFKVGLWMSRSDYMMQKIRFN